MAATSRRFRAAKHVQVEIPHVNIIAQNSAQQWSLPAIKMSESSFINSPQRDASTPFSVSSGGGVARYSGGTPSTLLFSSHSAATRKGSVHRPAGEQAATLASATGSSFRLQVWDAVNVEALRVVKRGSQLSPVNHHANGTPVRTVRTYVRNAPTSGVSRQQCQSTWPSRAPASSTRCCVRQRWQ